MDRAKWKSKRAKVSFFRHDEILSWLINFTPGARGKKEDYMYKICFLSCISVQALFVQYTMHFVTHLSAPTFWRFLFRFKTVLKSRQILTRVSVCSFRINMSSSSAAPLCRTAQTVPWRLPCVASAGCHWFRIACTLCKSSLLNLFFFFAACLLLLNVMINGGYFNDKKTMMLITIIITDFKDSGTGKDR